MSLLSDGRRGTSRLPMLLFSVTSYEYAVFSSQSEDGRSSTAQLKGEGSLSLYGTIYLSSLLLCAAAEHPTSSRRPHFSIALTDSFSCSTWSSIGQYVRSQNTHCQHSNLVPTLSIHTT